MKLLSALIILAISCSAIATTKEQVRPFTGKYVVDTENCDEHYSVYTRAYAHFSKWPDHDALDINLYGDDASMISIYLTTTGTTYPNGYKTVVKPYFKENVLGYISTSVSSSGTKKSITEVRFEKVKNGLMYSEKYVDDRGIESLEKCHLIKVEK